MPTMRNTDGNIVYYHPIDCVEMLKVGWTILDNDEEGVKFFPGVTKNTKSEEVKNKEPEVVVPDGASLVGGKTDEDKLKEAARITAKKAEAEAAKKVEEDRAVFDKAVADKKAKKAAAAIREEKKKREKEVGEAAQAKKSDSE